MEAHYRRTRKLWQTAVQFSGRVRYRIGVVTAFKKYCPGSPAVQQKKCHCLWSRRDRLQPRIRKENSRMSDPVTGVVKWFNSQKGFGFITPDDGSADVFAHYSNIEGSGIRNLYEDQKVQFRVENSPKGLSAVEIVALD